jgi:hypothetical protein
VNDFIGHGPLYGNACACLQVMVSAESIVRALPFSPRQQGLIYRPHRAIQRRLRGSANPAEE